MFIKYIKVCWYATLAILNGYALYTTKQVGGAWTCLLLLIGCSWASIVTLFDEEK